MIERLAVLFAFTVAYSFLWWLEWRLMKPVREENRRKRRERARDRDNISE